MSELVIEEKLLYLFADRSFYEPVSRYRPFVRDYHDPLLRQLPEGWSLNHRNLWWDCSPPAADIPAQGWKIHLSATPAHAPAILMTAARLLFEANVPFKFLLDRMMLAMINGKRWNRGGAGKFITAYPKDTAQCGLLLEALYQATIGYWGPFILSDRRYRDSRVVHYRYGGLLPTKRVDVSGKSVLVIQTADGQYMDDERTPYFKLPPGIEDPFEQPAVAITDEGEAGTLKNGRYEIKSVLAVSNPGGVYLALDRVSGQTVVIKEARPFTNVSFRGLDAMQLLKKEHRVLSVLADTGIAPKPLDFFIDWEHAYLVEEYLEGSLTLRDHLTRMNLLLRTRPSHEDSRSYFRRYCALFGALASLVKTMHARHIVFSDLSMANVMVLGDPDGEVTLKLIDFEGAYEEGVDLPTHLFTPGFSPEDAMDRGQSTREDDYYAMGGLLMSGLFPMNAMLVLNRSAHLRYLEAYRRDFDLPTPIADLICALLSADPSQRPGPDRIIEVLATAHEPRPPEIGTYELDVVDLADTLERMLSYTDSVADFHRYDRLYPADPMVFETNAVSLAHGACGVAYVMHKVRGSLDPRVLAWIRVHPMHAHAYAPGLYSGLAGVAWCLLEMGQLEEARGILDRTNDHALLWSSPGVFSGAAGWGMAQLRFFIATGEQGYLDAARRAGQFLVESREIDVEGPGCYWNSPEGLSASFAHGAAGISLFLLYLHLATGDDSFLACGEQGLDWVLAQGFHNPEGGLTWVARDRTPSYTPYWRWGSSGIGRTLVRYHAVTGKSRYADALDLIHIDCDRKYTIFPGYFFGIAGIAEMYLDMARFPRWESIAIASTRKLLAGTMLFPIEHPEGLAFPGESLSRISCDFGTGSSGIALVMHRYLTRCGASFMLDELIPGWAPDDRCP